MDPATLSVTAAAALTALLPYLPIIATKTAEKLGGELPGAVGRLWGAVKARFDAKPTANETLSDLLKDPKDSDLQAAFRVQLKKALEEDPAFAGEIKRLVESAGDQTNVAVRDGAVAIGGHAKAVGRGGIMIGGNATDNILITGDDNEVKRKAK